MATADPHSGGSPVQTDYAPVNGLSMYYEIYGEGRPLVLLHGAYMTTGMFGGVLPGLATTRRVIAAEQQGHGHTADPARRPPGHRSLRPAGSRAPGRADWLLDLIPPFLDEPMPERG